jgi:MGT family glycosyltransferase
MARILAFTVPAPGHLYPFVPILLALQQRGHSVRFGLPSQERESKKSKSVAGIRIRSMRLKSGAYPETTSAQQHAGARESKLEMFRVQGEPLAELLDRLIAEERPDVLLVDPVHWGPMLAAESSGIPWASLAHNPLLLRGLGVDVRGPGLRPARGIVGRARDAILARKVRLGNQCYLAHLNETRAARHLSPLSDLQDLYTRPPVVLATTAEPFEYPRRDWPAGLRFVGPLSWEPPTYSPAAIDPTDGRPLVLLAGSSIPEVGQARSWVSRALEAIEGEPYQIIATLPTEEAPRRVPSNVHIVRFVPHSHVLPRCACVVCHGGPGITQKALAAGVPVVAIPFAYDRFEVAQRVEVANAGVMLPGPRLTSARVRAAVRRAILCKPGAERIAEAFRRAGGAAAAADAVEGLLEPGWATPV